MPDRSNEFDLNDSVDRAVAVSEAARISAEIKDLQAELKWFSDSFRIFFHGGVKEIGHNGATVTVNKPNHPKPSLDAKLVQALFPVSEYPKYYKKKENGDVEYKTRDAAVTFSLK